LSAVETGTRGASLELIIALEKVYGLEPGTIQVDYELRHETQRAAG
jgi:hypothetical protein